MWKLADRMGRRVVILVASLILLTFLTGFTWPQFNGDPQHSGNNTAESLINQSNVSHMALLFHVPLPDSADGPPIFLQAARTVSGTRNLLFTTTEYGRIVALDANDGTIVWVRQHGPGNCKINDPNGVSGPTCYTTSSPALDPNGQYVYSYGLDGYMHKHSVYDGSETIDSTWPETATLKPYNEKGSSPLLVATSGANSYLYVVNSGYPGDRGDYQGHLTAINLATGAQKVFNTLCSNLTAHLGLGACAENQSGVWARSGVVYSAATDRIYLATGNATFYPAGHHWGDTVLALHPDGTGSGGDPVDSYTPGDYIYLNNSDVDLGSTNIAIIPVAVTSTVLHVGVQGGKDGELRLLNLDNLNGHGGPGYTGGEIGPWVTVPQTGEVLTAPAVWVNPADRSTWIFVANDYGISGLQVTYTGQFTPTLTPRWQRAGGGTSPLVANNVLYYMNGGTVTALNPIAGNSTALWTASTGSYMHWESPLVANSVLYIADQGGYLSAYSLYGVPPPPSIFYLPIVIR